jgi:hypothetical protein
VYDDGEGRHGRRYSAVASDRGSVGSTDPRALHGLLVGSGLVLLAVGRGVTACSYPQRSRDVGDLVSRTFPEVSEEASSTTFPKMSLALLFSKE